MEEKGNIYRSKEDSDAAAGSQTVPVGPALVHLRRRTWLTTALLALFMLLLLAGAIWILWEQEKKIRHEPSSPPSTGIALSPPLPSVSTLTPTLSPATAIPPSALPDVLEPLAPPPTTPVLTGEQSAQAMTELRMAYSYLRAQEVDKAEDHAKRALAIWPEWNSALRFLGVLYTQRGQFEQAITILEKAMAQNPMSVEAVNALATAYMQKGWMGRAEELLRKAEVMSPAYWPAQINLGLLYLLKKKYDLSAEYLARALEHVPNDPAPRNNLGVALMRLGRFEEARRHFQTLIEQRADNPAPYFNLAISYLLERKPEQALEWVRNGASRFSPVVCQRYLADEAFNVLRNLPAFQEILNSITPQLPGSPSP